VIDIPGYKIVRTLGKGGMATVYLAIQESFEREIALKIMNASLSEDPKFTARFVQEARVVSRLVHPNIVTVYDVGVQDNQHYLSMEYVPGMDLKHKLPFLTPPQSLQVIRDVARALDYAGKKGYVHRDVKPENIMLHDDDGRAVLMDFGIACLADTRSGMTQTGTAIGTPHYMSPEQAKGQTVDSRSDIYSLGVVLFLLLAGRVPYDADSAVAVGIKHVQEPIPHLPGNLRVLQPVIDKVLAKDPSHRYQSGAELIAAIDGITDEDIEAIQLATQHYAAHLQDADFQAASADAATVVSAELASATEAEIPAKTEPAAGDELPVGDELPDRDELLAVAEEDRRDYPDEDVRETRRWPWALAASLVLALVGGYYLRDLLTPPVAALVETLAGKTTTGGVGLSDPVAAPVQAAPVQPQLPAAPAGAEASTASLPASSAVNLLPVNPPSATQLNSPDDSQSKTASAVDSRAEPALVSSGPSGPIKDNSKDTVPASTPAAGEGGEAAARQSMQEQVRGLRDQLDNDLSVSPQLADLYRQLLSTAPNDVAAVSGLRELRDFHYRRLGDALEARDLVRARAYLASLEASFPAGAGPVNLSNEKDYRRLRERFTQVREAEDLIGQGRDHLAAGALTEPPEANALETYRRALAVDPGNPQAIAGLNKITARFAAMVEENLGQGDLTQAIETANQGLSIDKGNKRLAALHADASARLERQRTIERLESMARQQIEAGHYISPRGESAYDYYRELLALDAGNHQATGGIAQIERHLAQTAETHINRNEFDAARTLLRAAREVFDNSERLLALELALEQAVETNFLASQPRIPQVLVSSQPPDNISQAQADTLNVDRTIHIGFSYQNFEQKTSVVQVMLYDGSRTVQIAQVPVIVSGKDGVKFFQIDRPVEGFGEGGYTIDLILNGDNLNTLPFKVERTDK
jgi:serine/threonine-protein kinase PpkA